MTNRTKQHGLNMMWMARLSNSGSATSTLCRNGKVNNCAGDPVWSPYTDGLRWHGNHIRLDPCLPCCITPQHRIRIVFTDTHLIKQQWKLLFECQKIINLRLMLNSM